VTRKIVLKFGMICSDCREELPAGTGTRYYGKRNDGYGIGCNSRGEASAEERARWDHADHQRRVREVGQMKSVSADEREAWSAVAVEEPLYEERRCLTCGTKAGIYEL